MERSNRKGQSTGKDTNYNDKKLCNFANLKIVGTSFPRKGVHKGTTQNLAELIYNEIQLY